MVYSALLCWLVTLISCSDSTLEIFRFEERCTTIYPFRSSIHLFIYSLTRPGVYVVFSVPVGLSCLIL